MTEETPKKGGLAGIIETIKNLFKKPMPTDSFPKEEPINKEEPPAKEEAPAEEEEKVEETKPEEEKKEE